MAKTKFFSYNDLVIYDPLIKNYVDSKVGTGVSSSIKKVTLTDRTFKFYTVLNPGTEDSPVAELTVPLTDTSSLMSKIVGGTAGNVLTLDAQGNAVDSGIAATTIATKSEVKTVSDAVDAINNETTGILAQAKTYADGKDSAISAAKKAGDDAQSDVDALETLVGTLPADATATTVVAYAKEVADAVAGTASGIDTRLQTAEATLTKLEGADTVDGSIKKIAKDAADTAVTNLIDGAPEALDTLKEIADWISEQQEGEGGATELISKVQKNADAIAAEVTRATEVEGGLNTRVGSLETAIGEGGSVATQITNAINALDTPAGGVSGTSVVEGSTDGVTVTVTQTDGKVSNVAVTASFATAIADAKKAGTDAQSDVDALETLVGEIPVGGTATTVVAYAKEVADSKDAAISAVADRATALEGLVGDGFEEIGETAIKALFPTQS